MYIRGENNMAFITLNQKEPPNTTPPTPKKKGEKKSIISEIQWTTITNEKEDNGWSYRSQIVDDKAIKFHCLQQVSKGKRVIIRIQKWMSMGIKKILRRGGGG